MLRTHLMMGFVLLAVTLAPAKEANPITRSSLDTIVISTPTGKRIVRQSSPWRAWKSAAHPTINAPALLNNNNNRLPRTAERQPDQVTDDDAILIGANTNRFTRPLRLPQDRINDRISTPAGPTSDSSPRPILLLNSGPEGDDDRPTDIGDAWYADDEGDGRSSSQPGDDGDAGDGTGDDTDTSTDDEDVPVADCSAPLPLRPPLTEAWAPIAQPAGSGPVAIARWDVVPYQIFDTDFTIGVVAFHKNGIQRVDFYVNGADGSAGPEDRIVRVANPSMNPRTGVVEYTTCLQAAMPDGPVEVRAVIYPNDGTPLILQDTTEDDALDGIHSLHLTANGGGSFTRDRIEITPNDSLAQALEDVADGGEVILAPGDYGIEVNPRRRTLERWVTVRPAITDRENPAFREVWIRPDRRERLTLQGSKIHWKSINFDYNKIERLNPAPGDIHWMDNCHWTDSSAAGWAAEYEAAVAPFSAYAVWYGTDCKYYNTRFGPIRHRIARGIDMTRLSGEAFEGSQMIVNCDLYNMDGTILPNSTIHTDIIQWHDNVRRRIRNRIAYGIRGDELNCQQFFLRTGGGADYENLAFVGIEFNTKNLYNANGRHYTDLTRSQFFCRHEHVLFRDVRTDINLIFRLEAPENEEYAPSNCVFQNCGVHWKTWRNWNNGDYPTGVEVLGQGNYLWFEQPPPR